MSGCFKILMWKLKLIMHLPGLMDTSHQHLQPSPTSEHLPYVVLEAHQVNYWYLKLFSLNRGTRMLSVVLFSLGVTHSSLQRRLGHRLRAQQGSSDRSYGLTSKGKLGRPGSLSWSAAGWGVIHTNFNNSIRSTLFFDTTVFLTADLKVL